MLQWNQLKVHRLNERPHHPILRQRSSVCTVQLILRAASLHNRHAAKEDEEVGGCEDGLISCDTRDDLEVLVLEDNFVL